MGRWFVPRIAGASLALLLSAAAARAQTVHEVVAGGDAVSGAVSAADEVDRLPIRLVDGAVVSVTLKAAKGSLLLPDLVLLGSDRRPDEAFAGLVKANAKGNVLAAKNLPVSGTGLRWIEIRGRSGTTGGWLLTTKVKLPKGAAGSPSVSAAQGTTAFTFTAPGNVLATVAVSAGKGSAANPAFGGLEDPDGEDVVSDPPVPGKTGFSLKNAGLVLPGTYTLTLLQGTGGDGAVSVSVKWKVPRPVKRALLETQVITDPVATAVAPAGGNNSQVVAVTVTADFLRPGARVHFRKPPTVVTAQGSGLTVGATGVSFPQSLAPFQKGVYDVQVENPDGGTHTLAKAFTVVNAPATLSSVAPPSGFDSQSAIQLTVSGSYINGGAAVSLVKGADSIPGTGVAAASTTLTATFDLRGHGTGFFDVVVTNPDAAPAALAAAFEIVNTPPSVTALSPSSNIDAAVVACTITGNHFDATPQAALRRTGSADIPGTSVLWVSGTSLACSFDTTGAAVGAWDLVVTNPDGQSGTLASAFVVSGPVGPPAKALSAVAAAEGPPSVCWNATRSEYAVAWVDVNGSSWDVLVQRLDSSGSPVGSAVSVPSSSSSLRKRDAVVAWDSTNDQYLVAWCEPITLSGLAATHPSYGYTSVFSVFARRLRGSDLAGLGNIVQVTDHLIFSGYYMDEFNNVHPDACWDAKAALWRVVWMQEWSTQNVNGYGYDDWDVLARTVDASSTLSSAYTGVAFSANHEGEPSVVYDPVNQRHVTAWNYRGTLTSPLTGVVNGVTVVSDGVDTQDLRMAADPDGRRLLATWTKSPPGGPRTVQGAVFDLASPTSVIGAVVDLGSGSGDHFLGRPAYNASLRQALVAWTRKDASGGHTVRARRATTGTAAGLVTVGSEMESSSGSTDEGLPAVVSNGAETLVLWLKTLQFVSGSPFAGAPLPGTYQGAELWEIRYR